MFEYLRNNINNNGFVFLQETKKVEQKSKDDFKDPLFFSHEKSNSLNIERLLMTVDIEKAFDSINHSFLMCVVTILENGYKS